MLFFVLTAVLRFAIIADVRFAQFVSCVRLAVYRFVSSGQPLYWGAFMSCQVSGLPLCLKRATALLGRIHVLSG